MYAYIDRKKKLPVTTLLRAIGLESDKDIIEKFDLAEEVKLTQSNIKKIIGRKLAARVLHSWQEDFSDTDTGEVVSIERNETIVDRGEVLTEENIKDILESGAKTVLLEKADVNSVDYAIIFNTLQKDTTNSEREPYSTSIGSCATPSRRTTPPHARSSPTSSSPRSAMTWARWAATASTRSWT